VADGAFNTLDANTGAKDIASNGMAHRLAAEGTLFKIYPKEITRLNAPDFDS